MHAQDGAGTLMSIRDAALATGLSPKALRRRIERGTLASVMVGGRRRIPVHDLLRRGLISGHAGADWPAGAHPSAPDRAELDALARRLAGVEARLAELESRLGPLLSPADAGRWGIARDGGAHDGGGARDGGGAHDGGGARDGSERDGAAAADTSAATLRNA